MLFLSRNMQTDSYSWFKVIVKGIEMKTCFLYGNTWSLEIRLTCLCVRLTSETDEKYLYALGLNRVDLFVWKLMRSFLCQLVFCSYSHVGKKKFTKAAHSGEFFYWIWQDFSLKLIYGQYAELIPGIHLEFIQRLHQQSQFQLIIMMWYLGNATLCPCHPQSLWTRCATRHFNSKLVCCIRAVLLNWLLHIHWTVLWPVWISLSYTQGKKANSCISQKC